MNKTETLITRRAFLYTLLTMPPALILAACAQPRDVPPERLYTPTVAPQPTTIPPPAIPPSAIPSTQQPNNPTTEPPTTEPPTPTTVAQLEPTPACGDDDDEPTPAQTEGPYFTPNSPERASLLEAGTTGTRMIVSGLVLNTNCQPIARALVDFWHCDDAGVYDNVGFKLRGHQFTDEQGRYQLETIVPATYAPRTRHIHVKVQAANNPVLTTQLYFPNEPENARDGEYTRVLEMDVTNNAEGSRKGAFNFVLKV